MAIRVVTSFGPAGYKQYGRRFLHAFDHFFDPDIALDIYVEQGVPMSALPVRRDCNTIDLLRDVGLDSNIINIWDRDPTEWGMECKGRKVRPGWKTGDIEKGYCFRFDAVKFMRKVFAVADCAARRCLPNDILCWIDADTYAVDFIKPDFIEGLLRDASVAYLGRDGAHSECGFIAFRVGSAMPIILDWRAYYASGSFVKEREWHDSYLFDRAREKHPEIECRNIAEPGARGHVWFKSPLGKVMDHLKGDRKLTGRSSEMGLGR